MAKGDSPTHVQTAHTLLIVDDERSLRFSLGEWARDAVLLDLKLGDEDGLALLRKIREEDPTLPVIMLTGHGGVEHAVRATRLGAYDFIEKKPPYLEHLEVVIRRALEHGRLRREVAHWRKSSEKEQPLVGESRGFRRARQQLEKAGHSGSATVLVQGETGAGKELMARYLHAHSPRAGGPFIELNCSAIPEQLL